MLRRPRCEQGLRNLSTTVNNNDLFSVPPLQKSDPSNRFAYVGELHPSYIHRRGDGYQLLKARLTNFVYQSVDLAEEIKDEFYVCQNKVLRVVPNADKIALFGDFNARGGMTYDVWKYVIGRNRTGNINANRLCLLSFCAEQQLPITQTQCYNCQTSTRQPGCTPAQRTGTSWTMTSSAVVTFVTT